MLKEFWRGWGKELLVALVLALLIRAGVAEARMVPTPSMVPTVLPGDRLLAEKMLYRFTTPRRGDIIVFAPPFAPEQGRLASFLGLEEDYLKRVIGLPGETVEIRDGQVLVNGVALDEPYIKEAPTYEAPPVIVPAGHLFVLGDNRNQSYDSHAWGTVELSAVRSRAIFRFWPLNRIGLVR